MRSRWLRIRIACFLLIIVSVLCVLFSNETFATAVSEDRLYKLSILRGVRECYSLYAKSSINEEDYKNYLSIFDTGGDFEKGGSDDVWITTHVGNSQEGNSNENDSNMSCEQIFEGYKSSMKGLKSYYPNIESASLADMGYKKVGESGSNASKYDEGHRVFITIDSGNIKNGSDNVKYNFRVEGGGIECFADEKEISGFLSKSYSWPNLSCNGRIELFREGDGSLVFSIEINGNEVTTNFLGGEADYIKWGNGHIDTLIKNGTATEKGTLMDDFQYGNFNRYLVEDLENVFINQLGYGDPEIIISYSNDFAEMTGIYEPVDNLKNTADVMLSNLGIDSSLPNKTGKVREHNAVTYMWDVNYTYGLYYRYLQDVIAKHSDIKINTCSEDKGDEGGYFFKNTPTQWCRIQIPNDSISVLDDVYSIIKGEDLAKGTFREVLDWLKNEDSYSGVSDDAYANTASDSNGDLLINGNEEEAVCYANSGALGWIICPIVNGASWIGTQAWEFIEGSFLQIRAGDLFEDGGGTKNVWEQFRDLANIAFIVLFLFVIFSQLTGVGIDNYGIKKIMPRLIVVAIMVNLSFLICALAVDVSNILGSGLKAMFEAMARDIPSSVAALSPTTPGPGATLATVGLGTAGVVLFGILNPVGALTVGGAILGVGLAVLGITISLLFSILFMFMILIVRNAGVVLLIAISPIAIVCYMLPNTDKFYKQWFNMLKALLVVYPICGALIGAGKLAGNLLASIPDSPGMVIAGMIVNVLPFFLVPMLLRQSLRLMGNVGATLSSFGRNMGRRTGGFARNKITGSEAVKDWSNYQMGLQNDRRAARVIRRFNGRTNLNPRQQATLRKAQDVALARQKEVDENELRTRGGYYEAMTFKQEQGIRAEADAIAHLNSDDARRAAVQERMDEARRKQDSARVALMMQDYRSDTVGQLIDRWDAAFESGNEQDLSALTTVIHRRFGASGVNQIASKLSEKRGIADDSDKGRIYRRSLATLQRTMNDDSRLAGDMKAKASDAFQMISNAGIAEGDQGVGYYDMEWFTKHNKAATKTKDWITASTSTLERGLDSGAIDDEMLRELLTSDDPAIEAFRSDRKNRIALQAAEYKRRPGASAADKNLTNEQAADASKVEQQQQQAQAETQRQQQEVIRLHEEDALRRGKTSIIIPPSIASNASGSSTIQGYAVPNGFRQGTWSRDANGDHIYTESGANGRKWNASTGRYVR